ncbi:MAG: peptidoglycan DD-metalloendopeptidase family protein, partial [Bacilli bacterium]|nr:peptidoglycan DD-metalloendopeptidase family protein [Bacilli bacterium]
ITDIAFNNKLSPDEFLIANTSYKTANDLLYPGKIVTLGIIQPQFDTVEETHVVSKKVKSRETVYEDDDTQYAGYERVKEEGSDGESLITEKIQLINGEIVSTVPVKEEITVSPVNKVIVRGTKKYQVSWGGSISPSVDVPVGIGSWVWPTNAPFTVTSEFSYRWGKLHKAIDITGTGYGSPIKAANNGIVVTSAYNGTNGNYIIIKHANGYFTEYAHLATRYVQKGQVVYANDQIGTMGNTGYAQGVHLHFGLWTGAAYTGTPLNPRSLYQ